MASASVEEMQNGIFNLTVSMCLDLETKMGKKAARKYVSEYLDTLSKSLKETESTSND